MLDHRLQTDPGLERFHELLGAAQSIDDVVAALSHSARQVVGCDGVAVVLRDNGCCYYVAEDALEPLWKGQRFPLGECVSGWAMLNDETAVVPDIALDARVPVVPYRSKSICSLVMAAIGSPRPMAALGAYWCAHVYLSPETVARVEAMAQHATDTLTRIYTGAVVEMGAVIGPPQPTPAGNLISTR